MERVAKWSHIPYMQKSKFQDMLRNKKQKQSKLQYTIQSKYFCKIRVFLQNKQQNIL